MNDLPDEEYLVRWVGLRMRKFDKEFRGVSREEIEDHYHYLKQFEPQE